MKKKKCFEGLYKQLINRKRDSLEKLVAPLEFEGISSSVIDIG